MRRASRSYAPPLPPTSCMCPRQLQMPPWTLHVIHHSSTPLHHPVRRHPHLRLCRQVPHGHHRRHQIPILSPHLHLLARRRHGGADSRRRGRGSKDTLPHQLVLMQTLWAVSVGVRGVRFFSGPHALINYSQRPLLRPHESRTSRARAQSDGSCDAGVTGERWDARPVTG